MNSRFKFDLNKALPAAAVILAAIILLGTVAALLAGKRPGKDFRKSDPASAAQIGGGSQTGKQSEFKEFGTLRVRLAPEQGSSEPGAVLVVTPWLAYESNDSAFYEELVSKKKIFSSYILECFSGKTKNALLSIGEKEVKKNLLDRMNAALSLGKIGAIYFDDYMFLD